MKRQPARLPSARQSSSSAEVWWISSAMIVSRRVIRLSSNQRRAMPVVTMTTFQLGRLGGGLALAVDHPDPQRCLQDGLGDGADAQGLAGPGARHDAEALARGGEGPQLGAMFLFQSGLDAGEAQRELDGLAGGAGGGDDDHPATGVIRPAVGLGVGRQEVVAGRMHT